MSTKRKKLSIYNIIMEIYTNTLHTTCIQLLLDVRW